MPNPAWSSWIADFFTDEKWTNNKCLLNKNAIFSLCHTYLAACGMKWVPWLNVSLSWPNLSLSNMPWVFYGRKKCALIFHKHFFQWAVITICCSLPKVHTSCQGTHFISQAGIKSVGQWKYNIFIEMRLFFIRFIFRPLKRRIISNPKFKQWN